LKRGLGKIELFSPRHHSHPKIVDALADKGHRLDYAKACSHNLLCFEAGVPEAEGFKSSLRHHQPVATDSTIDSGVDLVGTSSIVRVEEH
jgi:hypothetical protein